MSEKAPRSVVGAQTLARGIEALKLAVAAANGLPASELGDELGVHRTIAHRILTTLADARLLTRDADGRYRGAVGLLLLHAGAYATLRVLARPVLQRVADDIGATASLLIAEGYEAVAVEVVEPRYQRLRFTFVTGSRHPIGHGSGGHALAALADPRPDDPEPVRLTRQRGYATTFGEVEPGAYGLAVPVRLTDQGIAACLNLISNRREVIEGAVQRMREAATELEQVARAQA